METGIVVLTLCAYAIAIIAGIRWRTASYLLILIASHAMVLPSLLWQRLYGFQYGTQVSALLSADGASIPTVVVLGAWIALVPAIGIAAFARRLGWIPRYALALLTYLILIGYHIVLDGLGSSAGLWNETVVAPAWLLATLPGATAHALVGLVVWFALDGTRRYGTISKALFLLPTPLLAALLVHGVVAAPRYITTLLALDELWRAAGTVGAMVLCLWGAHIVALAFVRSAPPAAGE
jgi:hypothetical protein